MNEPDDTEIEKLKEIVRHGMSSPEEARAAVEKMMESGAWETAADARILKALKFAEYAVYDGEHHKTWVIDQMVRALTGCPMITKHAVGAHDEPYSYEAQGESAQYKAFVAAAGGAWDEGIAP